MKILLSELRKKPFFHFIRHPYTAISDYNRSRRNAKERECLKDKEPTILCNDCLAGVIMKDYNLPCNAPIINCGIKPADYIRYLRNIEHYCSCELVEKKSDNPFPVGELVSPLGNIEIEFTHYGSFKEARMLWKRRAKRMNLNNIHAILNINVYIPATEDDIKEFNSLPYHKIIITTDEKFRNSEGCRFIDLGSKKTIPGIILKNKDILGHRYYNKFDFIDWLNQN